MASIERLRDGGDHQGDPSLPSVPENYLFRVNFNRGKPVIRDAFFISTTPVQRSTLAESMGMELQDKASIKVDGTKGLETSVSGAYAVGDANSGGSTNVPHALWSGKRSAVFAHGKSTVSLSWLNRLALGTG